MSDSFADTDKERQRAWFELAKQWGRLPEETLLARRDVTPQLAKPYWATTGAFRFLRHPGRPRGKPRPRASRPRRGSRHQKSRRCIGKNSVEARFSCCNFI